MYFSWEHNKNFEDYHMKIDLPFRVYADFECLNTHVEDQEHVLYEQEPIAVGYYWGSPSGNTYNSYFGGSCVNWFVDQILELQPTASKYFQLNLSLEITPEEEEQVKQSTECWLCEKPFVDNDHTTEVRYHDHLTDKYLGATCNKCS